MFIMYSVSMLIVIIVLCVFLLAIIRNKTIVSNESIQNVSQSNTVGDATQHINNTLALVSISLYRMYVNMELLDYDSMCVDLQRNALELMKNPSELVKWNNKLQEYMQLNSNQDD